MTRCCGPWPSCCASTPAPPTGAPATAGTSSCSACRPGGGRRPRRWPGSSGRSPTTTGTASTTSWPLRSPPGWRSWGPRTPPARCSGRPTRACWRPSGPGRPAEWSRVRLLAPVVAVLLCAGLAACGGRRRRRHRRLGPAATAGAYQVLVFTKTAGFRHASIPAGIAAIRELGAGRQVHRDRDRGRRPPSPPANLAPATGRWCSCQHHRRRARRRPADRASRRTSGRRRVRRHPLRRRHRVRLAVLRRTGRRPVRGPSGHPAGHRPGPRPGPPGHRAPAGRPGGHRRAVQLPDQPAPRRAGAGHPRRVDVLRRHHGRRPPDRLEHRPIEPRSVVLHRPRPHRTRSYADPVFRGCSPPGSGTRPADGQPATRRRWRSVSSPTLAAVSPTERSAATSGGRSSPEM